MVEGEAGAEGVERGGGAAGVQFVSVYIPIFVFTVVAWGVYMYRKDIREFASLPSLLDLRMQIALLGIQRGLVELQRIEALGKWDDLYRESYREDI